MLSNLISRAVLLVGNHLKKAGYNSNRTVLSSLPVVKLLRGGGGGGLLRNHTGKCLGAYVCNLGHCSITAAELRGALEGLKIAWREGYRKIQLSMNSTTAIKIIDKRFEDDVMGVSHECVRQGSCILDPP
ncbi:unnamed protein product [Linum tenue]|uniref:RNase H type-1 domain-containing protein n=1 Tax=Linum tenue TaxID=586396 RepID=A0AAV0KZR6_9ROSI|nr:unnamed protein product [Linum tenue]